MEKDRAREVVFTSLSSALMVGAFALAIALQFGFGRWIALPAALMAGSVAYVAHDLHGFMVSIKRAARQMFTWKPDWQRGRYAMAAGVNIGFSGATLLTYCFGLFLYVKWGVYQAQDFKVDFWRDFCFLGTLVLSVMTISPVYGLLAWLVEDQPEKMHRGSQKILRWVNPIALPFVAAYFSIRGLVRVVPRVLKVIYMACLGTVMFAGIVLLYVHTTERRVCMTATAMGTLIGVWVGVQTGQFVIGTLACGALAATAAFAEYRLVAPRLGLVPTRA